MPLKHQPGSDGFGYPESRLLQWPDPSLIEEVLEVLEVEVVERKRRQPHRLVPQLPVPVQPGYGPD